jgi:hypothetical protein
MVVKKKPPRLIPTDKRSWERYAILLILLIGSTALLFYGSDFAKLSPERRQKLEKELEDDLNAIVGEEQLPTIYVTIDLRKYPAEDSLELTKGKVILHLCLQDMELTNFRSEVVGQLTKWLDGVDGIPELLTDKIMLLGDT